MAPASPGGVEARDLGTVHSVSWAASDNAGVDSGDVGYSVMLPAAGHARLEVVDVSGRRVSILENEFAPGTHDWRRDGTSTAGPRTGPGLYLIRLATPWGTRTGRLVHRP